MKAHSILAASAIALVTATTFLPGPALAATSHNIDGTVKAGGAWFRSSTIRYTTTDGYIDVKLTSRPAKCDGVDWRLNRTTSGQPTFGTGAHLNSSERKTVAYAPSSGYGFQNNFKQHTAANGTGNYDFAGKEYY